MKLLSFLSLGLLGAGLVNCHSWVDSITVVGGVGHLTGDLGYIRGYEGHIDAISSYRLLSNDTILCKENQRQAIQTKPEFPRLKASPGSFIRASWLENGHTTLPGDVPGYDSGPVYWFGTTNPNPNTKLSEVRTWTRKAKDGSKLLGEVPFDDTMCAEPGSENRPLGKPRYGAGGGGPCKGQFQLPEDLTPGTTYTVYWVWDFSKKTGTLDPQHFEWYTSCMDIDIVDGYIPHQKGLGTSEFSGKNMPKLGLSAKFRGRI